MGWMHATSSKILIAVHATGRVAFCRMNMRTTCILGMAALLSCTKAGNAPSRTPEAQAKADAYVTRIEQRLAATPEDAGIRYCLCTAYDDAGRVSDALTCLEALDARGWPVSIRANDFHESPSTPEFQTLFRRSNEREVRVNRSHLAFTAPAQLVPENVAFDPKSGAFFLGSVAERKIVRVAGGRVSDFGNSGNLTPPLLSIVGMKVDAARRTLWAASEGGPSPKPRRSELLLFDIDRGELLHRFAPDDGDPHLFNDVVVSSQEDVFITDSVGGGVYRVSARGALRALVPGGAFPHANGIALSRDEKKLFVAYDVGIAVVDPQTGAHADLRNESSRSIAGIDGLYARGDELVAVQNNIGRARVVRIRLDAEGTRARDVEYLESGHPLFGDPAPTTGVLVGDQFYYIANFQLQLSRPLEDVQVLVLSLP